MHNLYFPICAVLINALIFLIFFAKERVNNSETKIYSLLISIGFLESFLACTLVLLMNIFGKPPFIYILHRIDYILMLMWVWTLFDYVLVISNLKKKSVKEIQKYTFIYNVFVFISFFFVNLNVINENGIIDTNGTAMNILFFSIGIYVVFMITLMIIGIKNNKDKISRKKFIPLIFLGILAIVSMIIRSIAPEILLISLVAAYSHLIMYFTIENPDVKMIKELEYAKGQAEKANLAKSDFLSSMSHEIRTPLNAIVGFSECILEENDLESAKEDARDIVIASQNLLEIVNGILDISKIEADKMEIVEINYNPRENFENLAKLMVPRIGEKPIILNTKLPEDLPGTLYGDCGKVKQIVTNILTNAVKYTEKGEINFEVNCINTNNECSLVISVEDTGRGIQDDKIESLFAKFERLDEDKNTTTEGTGLGLAITKKLTEMLGGTIVVQSKYGEGSKFTVYLKQQIVSLNEDITKAKETNDNIKIDYSSKKILIVDDNNINIKVAERLLREYKLNVESVISGFECLDKIKKGIKYDLILLDDMMPKMSGVETLHELKKIDDFNTPTIALTANALSGMREKYLEEGFNDYLSKPIEKLELKRVLETYLSDGTTNDTNKNDIKEELTIETLEIKENIESNKNNDDILVQNGIDINKGLELLGDIELYNETFNGFINAMPERLEKLEEYKNSNDMPNYAILAHATKSDSKYLGCTKLADIALNHELKSKESDSEYVNNNYDEFIFEINKVIEAGKRYLNKDE